jgi:hypothetical protein
MGEGGETIQEQNLSQSHENFFRSTSQGYPFIRSAEVGRHEEIPISLKEEGK